MRAAWCFRFAYTFNQDAQVVGRSAKRGIAADCVVEHESTAAPVTLCDRGRDVAGEPCRLGIVGGGGGQLIRCDPWFSECHIHHLAIRVENGDEGRHRGACAQPAE